MSNPTADSFVPCCGETHAGTGGDGRSLNKGRCFECCNDGKGLVLDLLAVNGGPTTGTFETRDGAFLEIVSVSMVPDHQFIKFGPTVNASASTRYYRLPRNVCCSQTCGIAYCVERNSSMVETGRSMMCVVATVSSSAIQVKIGEYFWFYKSMSASKRAYICAKPRAWLELGGDETHNALSLETGETLRCKAWSETDIGYEVSGTTACKDRCYAPIDVTITISGLAGMVIDDGAAGYTIVDDEYSVTFTGINFACSGWVPLSSTGQVNLDLDHATNPGYCLSIGLRLEYDDEAGNWFIRADPDEGDIEYGNINSVCGDPDSYTGYIVALSRFDFPKIECGDNKISGTGTVTVTDWFSSLTMGTADVTVTVN